MLHHAIWSAAALLRFSYCPPTLFLARPIDFAISRFVFEPFSSS